MQTIEIKITTSNDHSLRTETFHCTELFLSDDSDALRKMIDTAKRKFDPDLDLVQFPPKVIVKIRCEV